MLAVPTDALVNFYSRDELETLLLGVPIIRGVCSREGKNVSEWDRDRNREKRREGRERERSSHVQQVWLLHQSLRVRGQAWETALANSLGVRSLSRERESWRVSRARKVTFLRFSRVLAAETWNRERGVGVSTEGGEYIRACITRPCDRGSFIASRPCLSSYTVARINQAIKVTRRRNNDGGRNFFAEKILRSLFYAIWNYPYINSLCYRIMFYNLNTRKIFL